MSKKPERVSLIYKQNSQMHWLAARAQQLGKLNIILQNCLPLQFSSHCQLANIHNDTAIIHTDNASYASMLRFQAKVICQALSAHIPEPVSKLDVKVRPKTTITPDTHHANIKVSNKTAMLLNNTAAGIEDGPLKTALKKLAERQTD